MLKIVADDLGLYSSVDDGIILGLRDGSINEASLMANGETFSDVVLRLSAFDGRIGIHFVLVEEKSLSTGTRLPKNYVEFIARYFLGFINDDWIEKELEAQVGRIEDAGIRPIFLNSHQHLHLLPRIANVVIKVAKKHGIGYVRIVDELGGHGKWFRRLQLRLLEVLSVRARDKIIRSGLQCNDLFIGFSAAGNLEEQDVRYAKELAAKYPHKIIELGCHPGLEDEVLRNKYKHWGNYNWQRELGLLRDHR